MQSTYMGSNSLQGCMADNENFVADTIAAAEAAYKKNFAAEVKAFAKSNRGSLLGDLASMVSSDIYLYRENDLKFPGFLPQSQNNDYQT